MLSDHCFECIAYFFLSYFPSGELEKNILQAGAAQADADYSGAEFLDEFGQELLSTSFLLIYLGVLLPLRLAPRQSQAFFLIFLEALFPVRFISKSFNQKINKGSDPL